MFKRILSFCLAFVIVFISSKQFVLATRPPADDVFDRVEPKMSLPFTDLDGVEDYIISIIQTLIGLGGLVAAGMIVYGGYVFILSGGDSENIARGQRILTNAVIGLIIASLAFILVNFIIDLVHGAP